MDSPKAGRDGEASRADQSPDQPILPDLAAAFVVGVQRLQMPADLFEALASAVAKECGNPARRSFGNNDVHPSHRGERIDVTEKLDPLIRAYLCTVGRQYVLRMAGLNGLTIGPGFKVDFSFAWIVRFRPGDYLPIHHHTDSLSGIVYVSIPPQIRDSDDIGGKLSFLYGDSLHANLQFLGNREVDPVEGDVLIFPAWLQHTVYPYDGEGERLSLAFNLQVHGIGEP